MFKKKMKHSKILSIPLIAFVVNALLCTSSFGQELLSTKLGKGVNIMAKDSSLSVKIGFRFQTLFSAEQVLDDSAAPAGKEMQIRRSRLKFDGFAFSNKLIYKAELALSNRDNGAVIAEGSNGANIVLDAVVKYKFAKHASIWFGQTKLPGNRERVISSQSLQFVDRSALNNRYNIDRDLGVQLHHSFKLGGFVVREIGAVSMGQGRNITASDTGGLDYTARIEFLPLGEFTDGGDYFDSDLAREAKPKLSIGIGYNFNDDAIREGGQLGKFLKESRDLSTIMCDLMFKFRGFSLTSEYMNKFTPDPVLKDNSNYFKTGDGFNVQAGYLFKKNIEIAGRYTLLNPAETINRDLSKPKMSEGQYREYTLGFSKYFKGHSLKIQSDLSYIEEELEKDPKLRFRLQMEVAF
jgi:hypothetical protein